MGVAGSAYCSIYAIYAQCTPSVRIESSPFGKQLCMFLLDVNILKKYGLNSSTSSVSPELLQRFARYGLDMALLSINMKAIWQASFLKSCEQADQCNNSGETEEVKKQPARRSQTI